MAGETRLEQSGPTSGTSAAASHEAVPAGERPANEEPVPATPVQETPAREVPPEVEDVPPETKGPAVDVRALVTTFASELGRRHLGTYAAASTYCMLLSVFPALILVSAILPHTGLSENDMVGFLLTIVPSEAESLVVQVCNYAYESSGGILSVSILFMLWSAGFGMMMLTRGLNHINDVRETRNYFLLRLLSTLYTILMLALMVAVLLLQIYVRQLQDLWETTFPDARPPEFLTSAMRYVVLFVAGVVLFVILLTRLPDVHKSVLSQLPGAIVTAIGWELFSALFTLYVRLSQGINVYYGSLTTIVVLMLWVYWCIYIMLVGAFVNRFLELWAEKSSQAGQEPAQAEV